MAEYSCLRLSADQISDIKELFAVCFHESPEIEFFKWKYLENPAGEAIMMGVFLNDILVGAGAMVPEKINYYGEQIVIYRPNDLMIHPDHRRKGLSLMINKRLQEHPKVRAAPISYTLPSAASRKSFSRNNWKFVFHVVNYFKPMAFLRVRHFFMPKRNIAITELPSKLLDGYSFSNNSSNVSVFKSQAFINWRVSTPAYDYQMLYKHDPNGNLIAYLAFSIASYGVINVLDLDAATDEMAQSLIRDLEFFSIGSGSRAIRFFGVDNSTMIQTARAAGYFRNPFKFGPFQNILDLFYYVHEPGWARIINKSDWDISSLSYDDI